MFRLADQFHDLAQQEHAARFGFWAFLASELLLFSGLFALYAAYRVMYPVDFAEAVAHDDLAIGTINTLILITSSFTVALAVWAVRSGRSRLAAALLACSVVLGLLFLALKGLEWRGHFREGIFPGRAYRFRELPGFGGSIFFTLYFFMTGLHALHVVGGVVALTWVAVRTGRGAYRPDHHLPLELAGLYWHLVDVIRIFLWPLFYLTR